MNTGSVDWRNTMESLLEVQFGKRVENTQAAKKTANEKKNSLALLRTKLEGMKVANAPLQYESAFGKRKHDISVAGLDDEDSVVKSITVADGATVGSYDFQVTQLSTASKHTGSTDMAGAINNSSDVSGLTLSSINFGTELTEGTITIQGATITVTPTDTLQDLFDAIQTATTTAGTPITASYSHTTDTITLNANPNEIITIGSAADTSNFLKLAKLYGTGVKEDISSAGKIGAINFDATLQNANLANALDTSPTAGSFKVNGVQIDYDITTDSLNDLISRVAASDANVDLRYNPIDKGFYFESQAKGSLDVFTSDETGTLLSKLGLDSSGSFSLGANTKFKINGGTEQTVPTSTLTSAEHGISGLSFKVEDTGADIPQTVTINIESDNDAVQKGVQEFVNSYNSFLVEYEKLTKASTDDNGKLKRAIFTGSHDITEFRSAIESRLRKTADPEDPTKLPMASYGIETDSRGRLTISERFIEALQSAPADITELITAISDDVNTYLTAALKHDGTVNKLKTEYLDTVKFEVAKEDKLKADILKERKRMEAVWIKQQEFVGYYNNVSMMMQQIMASALYR